jgi:hypothetical protein
MYSCGKGVQIECLCNISLFSNWTNSCASVLYATKDIQYNSDFLIFSESLLGEVERWKPDVTFACAVCTVDASPTMVELVVSLCGSVYALILSTSLTSPIASESTVLSISAPVRVLLKVLARELAIKHS